MIVIAIIAIIAAIAIPNLIEARKNGNESAAIGALKTLGSAQTMFREGNKDDDALLQYGDLGQLSNTALIDGVLGGGVKQGYVFLCLPSSLTAEYLWMATANPVSARTTGDRYFATNHRGVVYYTTAGSVGINNPTSEIWPFMLPVGK